MYLQAALKEVPPSAEESQSGQTVQHLLPFPSSLQGEDNIKSIAQTMLYSSIGQVTTQLQAESATAIHAVLK